MTRRARGTGKQTKPRRRKAEMPKGAIVPGRTTQETETARLAHERDEALLREAANAEILRLISRSPGDLELVFRTILEHATRICNAHFGTLFRFDGENLYPTAQFNTPAALLEAQTRRASFRPLPGSAFDHLVRTKQVIQLADVAAEGIPSLAATLGGARSLVAVPMLKDDALIGTILIYHQEVRPFTDKQIELVKNFAAQAVIAIENARLLTELRQRTTDLTESLEQQTATANVLRVISSSPGELGPVFDAVLDSATRLCEANFGILYRYEGDAFLAIALRGAPPAFAEFQQRAPIHPTPASGLGRIVSTQQPVHIIDTMAEQRYLDGDPYAVTAVKLSGSRTLIFVPMLKDDDLIGAITIYRREVRPFTDKQIELLQNFAAQAVIAIENARLLSELRQSLEQQTATADVLGVISSSPGELNPVFKIILENATRICEAKFGTLYLTEGDGYRTVAMHNVPSAFAEFIRQRGPFKPPPGIHLDRVMRTKQVSHTADYAAEATPGAAATLGGARSLVCVPMLKDDTLIGAITIYRQEVRPFTDKQIALVQNFAAQAVIAIENTRLLNELRESLQQQTATADVLKVISTSPGELEPVFQAMLENAVRICEAKFGTLFRFEGDAYRAVATHNAPQELMDEYGRHGLRQPTPGGILDRMLRTKQVCHTADYAAESVHGTAARFGGARSIVCVPMLKDNVLIGAFSIYRQEVRPFTGKQIALLENFAAQAVIAIENARLLNELRESLQQQTATADVLKIISRSTFDLKSVLQTLVESAAKLCDADTGTTSRQINGVFYRVAESYGLSREFMDYVEGMPVEADRGSLMGRVLLEGRVVHIPDVKTDPEYTLVEVQKLGGYRTTLGVPMLREGVPIGVLALNRSEVRPFTDKQIELVTTFADQAVIAIENARLLNELRESLQQQTATAEVLRVISSSPGELEPVFQNLLDNATRLCAADFGLMAQYNGSAFQLMAQLGGDPAYVEYLQREPFRPGPETLTGRVLQTRGPVQIEDFAKSKGYLDRDPIVVVAVERGGVRTTLGVPMLRENELIGIISLYRQEVRLFTDKTDRAITELRRSSRDRNRERSAAQRTTRIAGTADRNLRGVEGHFEFASRHSARARNYWRASREIV